MRRKVAIPVLLLTLWLFPAAVASAETGTSGAEAEREIDWWFGGQIRFRGEARDNFDLDSSEDDDTRFVLSRVRLGLGVDVEDHFRFFFQAQDARTFGQAPPGVNQANLDMHQGYLVWGDRDRGWNARIGRQEWIYGDERMIGALDWGNIGRAFDGVRVRYQGASARVDGLWARLSTELNPSGGTTGSSLYGIYAHAPVGSSGAAEGYWLLFSDGIGRPGELGAPGTTAVHALGARATNHHGRFDYKAEAAVERGEFNGDDLRAYAFGVVAGWTIGGAPTWRAFAGYDFATGDRDSSDGKREEFFNFFPTNHKHYGYIDVEGWRNLRSYYFGARASWGKQYGQVKFHRFSLQTPGGPWKSANGILLGFDPTGGSGRSVGWEMDLNYRYSFMKKSALEGGFSVFQPGHFARQTRGSDDQYWAYLMLTVGF